MRAGGPLGKREARNPFRWPAWRKRLETTSIAPSTTFFPSPSPLWTETTVDWTETTAWPKTVQATDQPQNDSFYYDLDLSNSTLIATSIDDPAQIAAVVALAVLLVLIILATVIGNFLFYI